MKQLEDATSLVVTGKNNFKINTQFLSRYRTARNKSRNNNNLADIRKLRKNEQILQRVKQTGEILWVGFQRTTSFFDIFYQFSLLMYFLLKGGIYHSNMDFYMRLVQD